MARTPQYVQAVHLNPCGMRCFVLVNIIFPWQIPHNLLQVYLAALKTFTMYSTAAGPKPL